MAERDPRYDILFEPVRIGPKTARNRFFQVPHCNGMGYRDPSAHAAMRGVKAEGGWAVVCTEEVEIHPTGEITPFIEGRLWDGADLPALARVAEAIHAHDSLAGIELCHNGMDSPNLWSREVPMGPIALPVHTFDYHPIQARPMDLTDIREMRRWHRRAAVQAMEIGYDLIYVYAAHALTFVFHFLSRRYNQRTDEYGGSLDNRVRLLREVIEDTKDAVGHRAAVPVRISMDELRGRGGLERAEVEDMIGLLAELPDLWDVTLAGWANDSVTARFGEEGHEEPYFANVKKLTTKPVVGVGRYTSPDRMVSLVRRGVLDFIGAARPSIADPFLPRKIEEGRIEDIRECIGCNICVSGDFWCAPIRCTQNPSMGEEWRKGWHPERIRAAEGPPVLVIGAGPAGLECAMSLGRRGYEVTLAEQGVELGGRLLRESRLPGLSSYIRVRDYRAGQLHQLPNVQVYFDSDLTAEDVLGFGIPRVVVATGARWRADGVSHHHTHPMPITGRVWTPDDLMAGDLPEGRVLVWDDEHYLMGGVLAELLADAGREVTYATTANAASIWTVATMEQHRIQARLLEKGIAIRTGTALEAWREGEAELSCTYTGRREAARFDGVVLVTSRLPSGTLGADLLARRADWADTGIDDVTVIGDALAPAAVVHAVYAGRRYAEELDAPPLGPDEFPFRREVVGLSPDFAP